MKRPLVSVIIPTKNSERTLETVLKSVVNQTYSLTEIIVVDNYSNDLTPEIAKRYSVNFYQKGPERSVQRNYGVGKANGEYFIFLDSDIELSPELIEECVLLAEREFEVVTFPEIITGEGYWAKCRHLETLCYLGDDTIEAPRFYSRRVFEELKGFDEDLSGTEDWDLREKAIMSGYQIGRIKALTIHHEGRVSLPVRIRKKIYYGKTMRRYIKNNIKVAVKQVPFFRVCYWKNWKLVLADPIHALGFVTLKTLETIAVIFSFILNR